MKIVIYGLTITSAWGNGHATTYRSLVKALSSLGHRVRFIEKDAEWYRNHRDLASPDFCHVRLYDDWSREEQSLTAEAADADAVIIGSYFPDAMQATEALLSRGSRPLLFYDIDTPITMAHLRQQGGCEYLNAALIPHYDAYLSFSGGPILDELKSSFGARRALPFYCSVDPALYCSTTVTDNFRCDLSYLGTYARDRQAKLMNLLDGAAASLPDRAFLVAGAMYPDGTRWRSNIRRLDHVAPAEHAAFYSSSRFTLNLTRDDMVKAGFSPSVRLFEASACGAAILSDDWPGLAEFLTPGEEILLPANADDVVSMLTNLADAERIRIGKRARQRVLEEHSSLARAHQFEQIVASCVT